jgi:hypothetical protein
MLKKQLVAMTQQKRSNIIIHAYLCFGFQLTLCLMVFWELCTSCSYYKHLFIASNPVIIYGRFVCVTILHITMLELADGQVKMMKFAINHPYVFSMPNQAVFLCFL